MKRAFLLILTTCFIAVCSAVIFAACTVDDGEYICEHDYKTQTTLPTCTQRGFTVYACKNCSDIFTADYVDALGHACETHEGKDAACTEIGWKEYETCSRCDYTTYKEIPALSHDLQPHAAKDATCTEIGWDKYDTCSRCDYTTYKEISALSHDLQPHDAKEATCTEIGWNEYKTCSRGDFNDYEQIEPTYEHDYVNGCCKWCGEPSPTLDSLEFKSKSDGTYEVVLSDVAAKEVIIPSLYEKKFLTSIGAHGQSGFTALKSVIIPNSVTSVNGAAFENCPALTVYCQGDISFETGCPAVLNYKSNLTANDGYIYCYYGGLRYALKDGEAIVARQPSDLEGEIIIGEKVVFDGEEYGVTGIAERAFSVCRTVTAITVPSCVNHIGGGAFYNCAALESITLPFIGERKDGEENFGFVFGSNVPRALKRVIITGGSTVASLAFNGCGYIENITLPDSVTEIGAKAFMGCSALQKISLPYVREDFFGYLFGAESHTENAAFVPETLRSVILTGGTDIPSYAFYGCNGIKSISLPDSISSVGLNAFEGCALERVDIGDLAVWCGIRFFSSYSNPLSSARALYRDDVKITNLVIPDTVKEIGHYAFYNCTAINSVTIPEGVSSIGFCAFVGCSAIRSVTIPQSVTSVDAHTFRGCTRLESITFAGKINSIGTYAFGDCTALSQINLPDGVNSIGDSAFYNCSALEKIVLPQSVEMIGDSVFLDCTSLTLYCRAAENEKPAAWHADWNCSRPVVWGYAEES